MPSPNPLRRVDRDRVSEVERALERSSELNESSVIERVRGLAGEKPRNVHIEVVSNGYIVRFVTDRVALADSNSVIVATNFFELMTALELKLKQPIELYESAYTEAHSHEIDPTSGNS